MSLCALRASAEQEAAAIVEAAESQAAEIKSRANDGVVSPPEEPLPLVAASGLPSRVANAGRLAGPRLRLHLATAPKILIGLVPLILLGLAVGFVFLSSGVRFSPFQLMTVHSGSMAPAIPEGSVIFLERVSAAEVEVGDVITFDAPSGAKRLETHRVVAFEETAEGRLFVTKGDSNPVPDSWRTPATGEGWRHVVHVPYVGYILSATRSIPVRLALVTSIGLALGYVFLAPMWRSRPDALPLRPALKKAVIEAIGEFSWRARWSWPGPS